MEDYTMSKMRRIALYTLITSLAMGAMGTVRGAEEEDKERAAWIDHLKKWNENIKPTRILSWNAYSHQFIDRPTFKFLAIPKTAKYVAEVKQGKQTWKVESDTPFVSLEKIWPKMETKLFSLRFEWLTKAGDCLSSESSIRVKAPDFEGLKEQDADWRAAADKNMAYFINAAWNGKAPYREPGVPTWIWSCASPTVTPGNLFGDFANGYPMSYPPNTNCLIMWGLLAYADRGGPQSEEAMRLARITADWGLKNRLPDSGALPLFPYSTITNGKFAGGNEGDNITLLRASLLGVAYVDLYAATKHQPYLDYAIHIAKTTAKLQREDGSFPYRLHRDTGAVSEQYTPAAGDFAILVHALEPYYFDADLAMAAQRAINWTIAAVCASSHWKGVFEDVYPWPVFSNLSAYETQYFIRLLCQLKDQDPSYVPLAKRLNRFVEDQFVLFSSESEAFVHPLRGPRRLKGPLVFEQFVCWYPMEVHTGFWIKTLIELHKATGDPIYLEKARAAANAICALQFEDGQFSTQGMRYYENGKVVSDKETGFNWYNCNVSASAGLYALDAYLRSMPK
jgi:hypothetical protein